MAATVPSASFALQSITYSGNTVTLHFDRAVFANNGNFIISDGYAQSYVGASGLSTRIVGATDVHKLDDSDQQIRYGDNNGQDVVITLASPLKTGVNYSVTMQAGAVKDDANNLSSVISSPKLFAFTADGSPSAPPATPVAAVNAKIYFTDTGDANDFFTNAQEQTVTGTYSGTLQSNEFIQVSLDNGASWHKASTGNGSSWSYSGQINTENLLHGATSQLNGTLLARVSSVEGGSSASASQAYTFSNQPIELGISDISFSADTGSSDSDHVTNTAAQTISGTYYGTLLSGQKLQVSLDGGSTWINTTASDQEWQADVTLQSGTHSVIARAIDGAGNTSSSTEINYKLLTSTVSLEGKDLTLAAGSDGGVDPGDGITDHVAAVTLDVNGLHGFRVGDVIQIIDTDNGSAVVGSYVIQTGDLYYGTGDYLSVGQYNAAARTSLNISVSGLSDGNHSLAARVLDVAGNVSAVDSDSVQVEVDSHTPVLDSQTPQEGVELDASAAVLTFTFNENIVLGDDVTITVTDDDNSNNTFNISSDNIVFSGKTMTINLPVLTSGTHYSMTGLVIRDVAGNSREFPPLQFHTAGGGGGGGGGGTQLDGIALSADSGVADDYLTNVAAQTLSGSYSGALGGNDQIEVSLDGSTWITASIDRDNMTWSLNSTLADGTNTIEVRLASDPGTVISQVVTLDTTPPAAQIVPSATSFPYTSASQTITGQYSLATDQLDEVVQVSLDNGNSWQTATTANISEGISSWSVTGVVTNGLIEVRIGDAAGNYANYADSGRDIVVFEADAGTSFDTSSGSVAIFGGSGNNAFNLQESTHNILSGGAGTDTITLRFNNGTLALNKLFGIDVINMSPTYQSISYGTNTIVGINPDNVTAMTDLLAGGHKLRIDGNDTSTVYLGSGWSANNPSENSGYHTYHSSSDSNIVLLIGNAINIGTSA